LLEIMAKSLLIGYSGAMMPGSLLTYTIDKSLTGGARSGLIISIGHSLLELVLVVAILFGFGELLTANLTQIIIGFVGGMLLFWMGYGMIRDAWQNKLQVAATEHVKGETKNQLIAGAAISAANPYFIVWWAVIGLGLIMAAYTSFGIPGVIVFYIGHILADITWYSFVAFAAGRFSRFLVGPSYRCVIAGLGGMLIFFGAGFIWSGFQLLQL